MMATLWHSGLLVILVRIPDLLSACQGDWTKISYQHSCVLTGSSAVFPCSFTPPAGQTVTDVFWLINAIRGVEPTDIAGKPSYAGRVEYYWNEDSNNNNNCTLKLTNVSVSDSAEYRARIITDQDKWQSCNAIPLSVTDLAVRAPKSVYEGSKTTLSCKHTCELTENPTVIWRKNGEDLPVKQTESYDLVIQRVSSEDKGDYSCALKGHEGHPSKPVKLIVIYPPKNTSVSVHPPGEILEGTSVTLTCSSDANPPVEKYTWYKRLGQLTPKVGLKQIHSINIIASWHTGCYYCEVKNQNGSNVSTDVCLNVLYSPKDTSAWFNQTSDLLEGSSVTLTCSSHANPPVESYTWYRRTGNRNTEVGLGETITFNLTSTTAGLYHCEAKNRIGFQTSPAVGVFSPGSEVQRAALVALGGTLLVVMTTAGLKYWRRKKMTTFGSASRNTDGNTQVNDKTTSTSSFALGSADRSRQDIAD